MRPNLTKALMLGTALVAIGVTSISSAQAQTELTPSVSIIADDAAGVTETDATNTVIINSTGAPITLGANGTNSVIMNTGGNLLTFNISGAANPVTFADDIVETAGDVAINITDATTVNFQGNVSASPIVVGNAGSNPTTSVVVDTTNAENITFAGTINAVDADDTVNLTITNTQGGANTVNFTAAIGGTTAATAIDTLAIGADTTDPMDVTFQQSVNAGAIQIGTGNAANATNNVTFGLASGTSTVTGAITGMGAGDTNTVSVAGDANVTFVSGFGANIDAIQLGADNADTTVTIQGAVASGPITIGAGAGTVDTNSLTLDTTGGNFTVTPTIDGGDAGDTNNLVISGGNNATVTGTIGAGGGIDTISLSGSGTELTADGAITATTVNIAGSTTLDANASVTGAVNLQGANSVVEVADNANITGAVDNTSGGNGVGLLSLEGTTTVSGAVGATNSLQNLRIGGSAETATFSSTVNADTVDFDGATNLAFNDDVTANTIISFDGYDGTITLADNADVTGIIDNTLGVGGTSGAGTAVGSLVLSGTSTISGNVGATNALKTITAGATGDTATFNGTVSAGDIDVSGNGALSFNNTVVVTNNLDFADNDGTVNFADNVNFTGDIEDTSDDKGTVNFAGTSVVTGDLGNAGASLQTVNFNGGTGETVTVSGVVDVSDDINVNAGTVTLSGQVTTTEDVNFTGDGTVSFADGLVSIGDDILTGTDSEGTAIFLGSGTVGGDIGADGAELKVLTLSGTAETVAVAGSMDVADTNNIGSNIVTVGTTVDVDAGQTLNFTITGDTDGENGRIASTGAATVDATAVVGLTVDTTEFIADATTYTVIDGTGGAGVADLTTTITDNSFLLSFTQQTTDDANLVVVASRNGLDDIATTPNASSVGATLEALGAGGDANLDTIQENLQNATTAAEIDNILDALVPTVDGGFVTGGQQASAMSASATNTRLASIRTGKQATGMVAGQMGHGLTMWMKGFGQIADQDKRGGVDGYEADTYGMAIGIDSEDIIEDGVVGMAFSYANTDVDSDNANTTKTDIDSYQLSFYGSHEYANNIYASGMLGIARNKMDQTRHNVAAIAGNNASANFKSTQQLAYLEVGQAFSPSRGLVLTPHVSANYQHLSIDSYTETGSTANQSVSFDDMNVFELGVGVKAEWDLHGARGTRFRPNVKIGYSYDVVGDKVAATSQFTGGGAAFATNGADPEQGMFNAGAGFTYELGNDWAITAEYMYQARTDWDAHSASIRAGYQF